MIIIDIMIITINMMILMMMIVVISLIIESVCLNTALTKPPERAAFPSSSYGCVVQSTHFLGTRSLSY